MAEYNTKVKVYMDGTTSITYCSQMVFGQKAIMETDKKEQDIEMRLGADEGMLIAHPGNVEWQYDKQLKQKSEKHFAKRAEEIEKERERKRVSNLKRAKDKIYDIVYQNDFSYFLTITLSEDNDFSRTEPKEVLAKLRVWLSNQQQRRGLSYLLIPELHEKGGIHCHALINDCFDMQYSGRRMYHGEAWNEEDLKRRRIYTDGLPPVYNVPQWKYGFSTAINLYGERMAIAHYMTKYITKDLNKIFGKYYWSSRDLIRDTETYYTNVNYDEVQRKEYYPKVMGMKFKYEGQTCGHADNEKMYINPDSVKAWSEPPEVDYSNLPWNDD